MSSHTDFFNGFYVLFSQADARRAEEEASQDSEDTEEAVYRGNDDNNPYVFSRRPSPLTTPPRDDSDEEAAEDDGVSDNNALSKGDQADGVRCQDSCVDVRRAPDSDAREEKNSAGSENVGKADAPCQSPDRAAGGVPPLDHCGVEQSAQHASAEAPPFAEFSVLPT